MARTGSFDATVEGRLRKRSAAVTFFSMLTQKGLVNGNRLFVMQVFFLESFKSISSNDFICVAITSDDTMNSERAASSVWIRLHNYSSSTLRRRLEALRY